MTRARHTPPLPRPAGPATGWWLAIGMAAGLGVLLLLAALGVAWGWTGAATALTQSGWPPAAAEVILRNRMVALLHGAVASLLAAAGLWLLTAPRWRGTATRRWAPLVLVLLVAADARWLARHYIHTMPRAAFAANPVTEHLAREMPQYRVALVSQDGFYNAWLTYLFPYHGIQTFNITQMPRMPADYQRFLDALGNNPLRLWELSSVSCLLGPAGLWQQLAADPAQRERFDLLYAYDTQSRGPAEVAVRPPPPDRLGQHVIVRWRHPLPRYVLLGAWRAAPLDDTLPLLAAPDYVVGQSVLLPPAAAATLPPSGPPGQLGQVRVLAWQPGRVRLAISSPAPALLRIGEKFDPAWRATRHGEPVPIWRADFIFQALVVPAGDHEIELRFAPEHRTLWLQAAAALTALLALIYVTLITDD